MGAPVLVIRRRGCRGRVDVAWRDLREGIRSGGSRCGICGDRLQSAPFCRFRWGNRVDPVSFGVCMAGGRRLGRSRCDPQRPAALSRGSAHRPALVHSVVHSTCPHRLETPESCRSTLWTTVDSGGWSNHIGVVPPDVDRSCPQGCGEGWGHGVVQDPAVHTAPCHPQATTLSTGLSTAVDNVDGPSTGGRGSGRPVSRRAACA